MCIHGFKRSLMELVQTTGLWGEQLLIAGKWDVRDPSPSPGQVVNHTSCITCVQDVPLEPRDLLLSWHITGSGDLAKTVAWEKEIGKILYPSWKALCQVIVSHAISYIQGKIKAPKPQFVDSRLCWPGGDIQSPWRSMEFPALVVVVVVPIVVSY